MLHNIHLVNQMEHLAIESSLHKSSTQSFVLFQSLEANGSSVKDIAVAVQLDPPAITGLVDRLSKEGFVERQTDPDNRRTVKIYLIDRGQEAAIQAGMIAQEFNEVMHNIISAGDLAAFEHALSVLEEAVLD